MSYNNKSAFLSEYRELCEKYKVYLDTGYAKPFYVMEFWYPVDKSFERTMDRLYEDIGE
ncbi:MAG: hypothetical protein U9Q97_10260 [Acidobacteriota bacterium]|nr:hypothetical protein [Acidobacteriota bacterium]